MEVFSDLGWRLSTGEPISERSAYSAVSDTLSLLEHMGTFETDRGARSSRPTPKGQALARAALKTSE